jgi:DNA repair exonuclease SbcCD ATPase subunit
MRIKSYNCLAAAILLSGLCLATIPVLAQQQQSQASPAQQSGDPVADAARKAREQQKATPKPKKVYTDDDVKPATPSPDAGPAPAAGGAQAAPGNGTDAAANGTGKGEDAEKVWRKRFQDQRDKIAAAEKELDILQREDDKAQVQYYNDPTKAMNEQYTRKDINDKNAKIDQKKQQIEDLKKQLSDMEDDLRKAGGDPGWAR